MALSMMLLRAFIVLEATGYVDQPILLRRVVNGAHASIQKVLTSKTFLTVANTSASSGIAWCEVGGVPMF